jgi:hypothetical protein
MSISGILASVFNHQQTSATSNPYQQQIQQLGQALQSGNLSAAQSDFATLQQAFSQPATTTGPASTNTSSPVNQSFRQLASDLQSGNLTAAQKDFYTIQQGIKPQGSPLSNHFHYHVHSNNGGESAGVTDPNSLDQNLNQLAQSLTSGNPAGAQQAYATLQQQLQQFALGGKDGAGLTNLPVSLVA